MITRGQIHRQAELVLIEAEWAALQREQFSLFGRWRRWYGRRTATQKVWAVCSVVIVFFGFMLYDTITMQDKATAEYHSVRYTEMDPELVRFANEAIIAEKGNQGGPEGAAAGPRRQEGLPQAGPQR